MRRRRRCRLFCICASVSARSCWELQTAEDTSYSRSDDLAQPGRVCFWYFGQSESSSFHNYDDKLPFPFQAQCSLLKSLTDNFVFPSPALLNISRNLVIRSDRQLHPQLGMTSRPTHVDLHCQVVMRQLLLTLRQPLPNRSPHT